MGGAALRKQLESVLGGPLEWQSRPAPEYVPCGVPEVDGAMGGLPRGALAEIFGPASSGRTSLLLAILAAATARQEVCALVDAEDAFDPASAAAAGVHFNRLLWVRCGHNAEHALQAADLLIQGGGFGLVAMDLGDTPPETARRVSLTSWFRLRRAVEHTPAVLLVVARQANAKTCASLLLECGRKGDACPTEQHSLNRDFTAETRRRGENAEKTRVGLGYGLRVRAAGEVCAAEVAEVRGAGAAGDGCGEERMTGHGKRWPVPPWKCLLEGISVLVTRRKPGRAIAASFYARARE